MPKTLIQVTTVVNGVSCTLHCPRSLAVLIDVLITMARDRVPASSGSSPEEVVWRYDKDHVMPHAYINERVLHTFLH